ncbi:hypothetical protein BDR22DRAFT_858246 [Usnea florida]
MSPTVCKVVAPYLVGYLSLESPCLLTCFTVFPRLGLHFFFKLLGSLFRVLLPALLMVMSIRSIVLTLLPLFGPHGQSGVAYIVEGLVVLSTSL